MRVRSRPRGNPPAETTAGRRSVTTRSPTGSSVSTRQAPRPTAIATAQSAPRVVRLLRFATLPLRLEVERRGVDAVAQPRRVGAVVEDVAEVRRALRAVDFRALHEQ